MHICGTDNAFSKETIHRGGPVAKLSGLDPILAPPCLKHSQSSRQHHWGVVVAIFLRQELTNLSQMPGDVEQSFESPTNAEQHAPFGCRCAMAPTFCKVVAPSLLHMERQPALLAHSECGFDRQGLQAT